MGNNSGTNTQLKESNCSVVHLSPFLYTTVKYIKVQYYTALCILQVILYKQMSGAGRNTNRKEKRQQRLSMNGEKKAKLVPLSYQWGTQWHSAGHIIMSFIPDTQQPPLEKHCGSLKPLSLWNVPDFQRNKELFGGRQTGKAVCKPAEGKPASTHCSIYFDQVFL